MYSKRINNEEAARVLGIRPGTLAVWRSQGRGPRYKKIGGRVFYDIDDVELFANAFTVETIDSLSLRKEVER